MKYLVRISMIIALMFAMNASSIAQERGKGKSPEQRAEKITNKLTEKLDLSSRQVPQVKAIVLDFATKMQEARQSNQGDKEAMKEIRKQLRSEKKAEMQAVLTEEQFEKLKELKKERREGRKGSKDGRTRSRG